MQFQAELFGKENNLGVRAIGKELFVKSLTKIDQLIDAMIAHPKLIERPIVVKNGKARLGRPPEQVLEIV